MNSGKQHPFLQRHARCQSGWNQREPLTVFLFVPMWSSIHHLQTIFNKNL